ncbi:uroporphyrinogen-III synthase [Sphingomonas sp. LM7]|uniref:uroporphyrinogen-III synthase n=1 Tax=Sphingomonas sp. LM7 TaxID=1938607 RepID=UPI000983DB3A|nr:uroporphyrinogen-III synthase [Sphingomonas sp. LM7]AQR74698.1 uroporphyrinogen-III synthase [Sphingomonas sp. LM7]
MTRQIAVLRPEPGNRVTAAAIEARGRTAIRMPLFEVRPVAWGVPAAEAFDALILTSANAVRHGGAGLSALHRLPVHAVGKATADSAQRAGFDVVFVGEEDAAALTANAQAAGIERALHLAGRERTIEPGGVIAQVITVYASETLAPRDVSQLDGCIALVQSARGGVRLGEVVDAAAISRSGMAIVALSQRAAAAVGGGWEQVVVPESISSEALIDAAIALAD